jgi:hypothetical protein
LKRQLGVRQDWRAAPEGCAVTIDTSRPIGVASAHFDARSSTLFRRVDQFGVAPFPLLAKHAEQSQIQSKSSMSADEYAQRYTGAAAI